MNAIRYNGLGLLVSVALFGVFGAPAAFAEEKATTCEKPSDCSGPAPRYCRRCDNGHFGCAHWACVEHGCKIATCDD